MKIVFTPDGEIRVLPLAATGWDVATAINPQLVKRMTAIIVDGKSYLPSNQIPHASVVQVVADITGVYLKDRSWMTMAMPKTRRILKDGIQRAEYENTVADGVLMARKMLANRGVLTFEDIRNEITPRLSELGCRTTGELLFAIGAGEIDEKRLDAVLDHGKVNKETLGLTTILVHGRNETWILAHLTTLISSLGGNIVRNVNHYDGDIFEIRIVIRGLGREQEEALREELGKDGRYSEVLVV
jgi:(p)ppGpp synthase/HD superfamily hydrolase